MLEFFWFVVASFYTKTPKFLLFVFGFNRSDTMFIPRITGTVNVQAVIIPVRTFVKPVNPKANVGQKTWHICVIFRRSLTHRCAVVERICKRRQGSSLALVGNTTK